MVQFLNFLDDNDEIRPEKRLNLLWHKSGTYYWEVPTVCSPITNDAHHFRCVSNDLRRIRVVGKLKYINWETTFPECEVLFPVAGQNSRKWYLENHFKTYLK